MVVQHLCDLAFMATHGTSMPSPPKEITDDLYLRALARKPTKEEWAKLEPFFTDEKGWETALNDLFWSLLNSKEFMFNH